jgi:hypothetical protein
LPRESNLLAIPRIDGAAEVGIFATGDAILTRIDDLDASIFPTGYSPVVDRLAIGAIFSLGAGITHPAMYIV